MKHLSIDFDVVIPTLNRSHRALCEKFLDILPENHARIFESGGKSWPSAVNLGLAKTKKDVLLMDDDIFVTTAAFDALEKYHAEADVIGFKLMFPNGTIQHAGGVFGNGIVRHRFFMEKDRGQADAPAFVAHVTTSMCFIKRRVLDAIGGMAEDYPGMQFEDVDFMLRAVQAGFKILYVPGPAVHLESATKKDAPMFKIKMRQNYDELSRRFLQNKELMRVAESFPKPFTSVDKNANAL